MDPSERQLLLEGRVRGQSVTALRRVYYGFRLGFVSVAFVGALYATDRDLAARVRPLLQACNSLTTCYFQRLIVSREKTSQDLST